MSSLEAIVTGLAEGTAGAIFGSLLTRFFDRKRILEVKRSYNLPIQVAEGEKRNIILLVGLGGTGKTSLSGCLFQDFQANPNEKTIHFHIYEHQTTARSIGLDSKQDYRFFITDYRGQNIAQLIREFIAIQKRPYSPLAFGYINSLIILVDLFPPRPEQYGAEINSADQIDMDRVKENLKEWNDTALKMLSGLFTQELKNIYLFINKVDLLTRNTPEVEQECKKAYAPLTERITRIFPHSQLHIILGSAKNGRNIVGVDETSLKFSLILNSVSPEN